MHEELCIPALTRRGHLQSEKFARGLHSLLHVTKASRTAIMCSELLWWRCHRRLMAGDMPLARAYERFFLHPMADRR